MKVAGIICEYNPFHLGHAHLLQEVRNRLGKDTAIICVMSGNFVQRGDFAIFNKHARAKAAILGGADLILELPVFWSLASAERFACGGVSLLQSTGVCTHLCFGSETGDTSLLSTAANYFLSDTASVSLQKELQSGISFAAARQRAAEKDGCTAASVLQNSNDILGIEYIKALIRINSSIVPMAIQRLGAEHDSPTENGHIVSASQIRQILHQGREISSFLPSAANAVFQEEITTGRGPVSGTTCESAILSRLRTMPQQEYESLPDNSEGLALRLMRYAKTEPTVEQVLQAVKTKRYAMSRLRRMILCAYLGIYQSDLPETIPYIRPLAFNRIGKSLLREMRTSSLPIITKPASVRNCCGEVQRTFAMEAHASDLYTLAFPQKSQRKGSMEWQISPIYMP